MSIISHCPHCGAPIYDQRVAPVSPPIPAHLHYSCECRLLRIVASPSPQPIYIQPVFPAPALPQPPSWQSQPLDLTPIITCTSPPDQALMHIRARWEA